MKQWVKFMGHCLFSGDRVVKYHTNGKWRIGDVVITDNAELSGTFKIIWKKRSGNVFHCTAASQYIYYLLRKD
jgi:hypothetical protein